MSEYTPTTDEVREWYTHRNGDRFYERRLRSRANEFDRWLAAHDAEVRADAFNSGYAGGAASVVPEEPEIEYRIDDGKLIAYSRSKSRADRALAKGARVWRRTPERRASAWLPVEQEEE